MDKTVANRTVLGGHLQPPHPACKIHGDGAHYFTILMRLSETPAHLWGSQWKCFAIMIKVLLGSTYIINIVSLKGTVWLQEAKM